MAKLWIVTKTDTGTCNLVVGPALRGLGAIPKHQITVPEEGLPPADPGDVVVLMGAECFSLAQDAKLFPKNRGVKSSRSWPVRDAAGVWYLASLDPGMVHLEEGADTDIRWDFRLADRLLRTGSPLPELGDYDWADDLGEVLDDVSEQYEANVAAKTDDPRVPVAVDTETMTLNPWDPANEIVCVQVCPRPGWARAVYTYGAPPAKIAKVRAHLSVLLTSKEVKIVGANLKYDLIWLWVKWRVECLNFVFDTGVVGSLLDEGRSNSLNTHAKVYTTLGGYDDAFGRTYDKGRMQDVPLKDLLPYACGDADACLQTYLRQREELVDHETPGPKKVNVGGVLTNFYVNLLHPSVRAFESIENVGMVVDAERFDRFGADLAVEIEKTEKLVVGMLSQAVRQKHADNLKLTKASLIVDQLFTPLGFNLKPLERTGKTQAPSTAAAHLSMFASHPEAGPFIKAYEGLAQLKKLYSTYYVGFKSHLRPDHRWHPTYYLYQSGGEGGTVTGRTSARDPAVQTIPKRGYWAKRLRDCVVAPPGYVIISADFDQGELRVTAAVAGESVMLDVYRNGGDLHVLTAAKINEMEPEDLLALKDTDKDLYDTIRSGGKAGNFGLIYGMQAPGWVHYAWATYGVSVTLEQARFARDTFFSTYPGLSSWHARQKNEAHTYGCVTSPLGRVRHLPLIRSRDREKRSRAERQAINSPVQSTLTDMCTLSIAEFDRRYSDAAVFGMVHDNNLIYAPEDQREVWAERVVEVMSTLPLTETFGWEPGVDFPADAEIGLTLGKLEKMAA